MADMAKKTKKIVKVSFLIFDLLIDIVLDNLKIVGRNISLFLGLMFFLLGLFSFESDKYCDGNMANYLSCTRPTTYYYYSWWGVTLIVAGALLIAVWALKRKGKS